MMQGMFSLIWTLYFVSQKDLDGEETGSEGGMEL
jgi:hypothetical protein